MDALDRLIPKPRLREHSAVEVAVPAERAWEAVRHGDLARSRLIRLLFAVRLLPDRLAGKHVEVALRMDDFRSSPEEPGFRIFVDHPPREIAVGAIGKVWKQVIPFVHLPDAEAYAAFAEPDQVKVAWAVRVTPYGENGSRIEIEVRVDATDDAAWSKFRRYFRLIGPGSHFIRRVLLASLVRELGSPAAVENERPLPGDELLPDARAQLTRAADIAATPEQIWPWLVQMGCRRAGFYSLDALDNAGVRSAREIHPEFQALKSGDVIAATPDGEDGFEVLRIEAPRMLALGGLYDVAKGRQLVFAAERPERFWHVTWVFALEPLDANHTRLQVRARGAFPPSELWHALWIRPVHELMQSAQLRHLSERVEGRAAGDDYHDVLEGIGGAAAMLLALLSPFEADERSHFGLGAEELQRSFEGDELVQAPRWGWTHAVEIDAPAAEVWPWVAQLGADRGGFYSYQWLENLIGCGVRNAETVHPEWALHEGDGLVLHPKQLPLKVVSLAPGHHFVAHMPADETARAAGKPWVGTSWLILVEPLGAQRCRVVSRYRCAMSEDLRTRVLLGPLLFEPISFAMDRRMLGGIKQRAERLHGAAHPPP